MRGEDGFEEVLRDTEQRRPQEPPDGLSAYGQAAPLSFFTDDEIGDTSSIDTHSVFQQQSRQQTEGGDRPDKQRKTDGPNLQVSQTGDDDETDMFQPLSHQLRQYSGSGHLGSHERHIAEAIDDSFLVHANSHNADNDRAHTGTLGSNPVSHDSHGELVSRQPPSDDGVAGLSASTTRSDASAVGFYLGTGKGEGVVVGLGNDDDADMEMGHRGTAISRAEEQPSQSPHKSSELKLPVTSTGELPVPTSHHQDGSLLAEINGMSNDYPSQHERVDMYIYEMICSLAKPLNIRGKQGRVTLWEATKHFDIINDLVFIYRVACTVVTWSEESRANGGGHSGTLDRQEEIGWLVLYSLIGIWVTSVVSYATRSLIIYHRIDGEYMTLFCPFVVFRKIRQVGEHSPENLYMFERLSWTYQILIRIIEDIPQVLVSAVFSAIYGADTYACFMICWSFMLMIVTSYRMGVNYPLCGTVSLLVSRRPPVDTPQLTEAAHTTRGFVVFIVFTLVVWSISNAACLRVASGVLFMWFLGIQIGLALLTVVFLCYYHHLRKQVGGRGGEVS
eukprot:GHVN01020476.1.p1 GENE.GHVN01020476.1~~GHVN01020476.1.p1  ORF type:complete len:560 (+),score=85.19 GHVN01020476.1:909-2588(+)